MKHHILAKFKSEISKKQIEEFLPDIKSLFNNALSIEGISKVEVIPNCIARPNRYDLLIVLTMEKQALEIYDNSDFHHQWKEKYGSMLESKAIFDCE